MGDYLVVITDHDFEGVSIERSLLEDISDVTVFSDEPGEPITVLNELTSADAILNVRSEIDAEITEQIDQCKILVRNGSGVDNIDIDAATKTDILVTNVLDYCVEEVATHAFALALVQVREINTYIESVEAGTWARSIAASIHRFSTLTVGIIGYGNIRRELGQYVSTLVQTYSSMIPSSNPLMWRSRM